MIEYDLQIKPHEQSRIGRAYTQWDTETQQPIRISVVLSNVYKDEPDIEKMVEVIDGMILCEIICSQTVEYTMRGEIQPLCVKNGDICPVIKLLIEKLGLNYNLEGIERDILLYSVREEPRRRLQETYEV